MPVEQPLARIVDPEELDRASGHAAKLSIDVLDEWLEAGDTIAIVVPHRLGCARCDGGGCDACGRSGAYRVELDEADRTLQITLPPSAPKRSIVRVMRPFGAHSDIELLFVEIRASAEASESVRRLPRAQPPARGFVNAAIAVALLLALLVLLAVLAGR